MERAKKFYGLTNPKMLPPSLQTLHPPIDYYWLHSTSMRTAPVLRLLSLPLVKASTKSVTPSTRRVNIPYGRSQYLPPMVCYEIFCQCTDIRQHHITLGALVLLQDISMYFLNTSSRTTQHVHRVNLMLLHKYPLL